MRIAIIGTGALATYFASKLKKIDDGIVLYGSWRERMDAIHTSGLVVVEANGSSKVVHLTALEFRPVAIPYDLILILVKSFQTAKVAAKIAQMGIAGTESVVLTLQNGMGNLEALQSALPGVEVIAGATTQAALNEGIAQVRNTGTGKVLLGLGALPIIADIFEKSGIRVESHINIDAVLWGKLVVNCSINMLTAVLGQPNGYLLENDLARRAMYRIAMEGQNVAKSCGITLFYQNAIDYVDEVVRQTASNISSTLVDILNHRETELDAMNGFLIARSEEKGVPCPMNSLAYGWYLKNKTQLQPDIQNTLLLEKWLQVQ